MFNKAMLMAFAKNGSVETEDTRYTFRFVASKDGSEVNFFKDVSSTYHDPSLYKVYINGEETAQTFTALTFSLGDEVKIVYKGEFGFPFFKMEGYCSSVSQLPYLVDNLGRPFTYVGTQSSGSIFMNCKDLSTVPEGLFDNNTSVTNFSRLFSQCDNLTTIPNGLFDSNTGATSFYMAFDKCPKLTAVPDGLFDNNTEVTVFEFTFNLCSSLTSIPVGLFDNNTKVTSFKGTFTYCTGLTSIPEDLFANNTNVTSFESTFESCNKLTSIPESLFANNTAVTTFKNTFYYCKNLSGRVKIGSPNVTNCANFLSYASPGFTVIVPAGSTTETTFRNYAATVSNLTVETF